MLYTECTQMLYLCQVIKSNLKTIYTLILPSQGIYSMCNAVVSFKLFSEELRVDIDYA